MNSIQLGNAVEVARLDVEVARDRLVPELLCGGGLVVIGGLFAITEWPHAAIACAVVALAEGIGAFRSWRRLRAAKRDLAHAEGMVKALENAEWIALCERIQRENVGDRFTPSGAYEVRNPRDAA